jgi:predicted dehydrogenase
MRKLSVLILGCGEIAGGYDELDNCSKHVSTHAKAFQLHGGYHLKGCVDINHDKRVSFAKRWMVDKSYSCFDEAIKDDSEYDVISICTPTSQHVHDLYKSLKAKPKLVFCEKPITNKVDDAVNLVTQYKKAGIYLVVNYMRRWEQELIKFKKAIKNNEYGKIRSVVGYYNKGIMNNGSHMIDLLQFICGPLSVVAIGKPEFDYFENDPTIPALLETTEGISVHLATGVARDFSIFEIQFVTSIGVITLENGGGVWRVRKPRRSDDFKAYHVLERGYWQEWEGDSTMSVAVDNIYEAITAGKALASTGEITLSAQRLCYQICNTIL